ncbi:hypothetical protein RJT34_16713 [Clitoria ternatea]|uniref:Uncharacterized protein n=1 Tax=Clitoria ternatea TaxID=43366 RepID=A0AAN9PDZ3_CLITE
MVSNSTMPRTNQVLNSLLEEAVLISEELYVALSYEDGCPVEGNGVGRKVIDRAQETYSELNGKGFSYDDSRLEEEVAKKKEEFHNDATIRKISEQCEADKIQFQVEVLQGNVPDVAINASIRLEATSVILDKRMKKYKEDFIESLYCTLLIMKRDNTMQQTKGSTAL